MVNGGAQPYRRDPVVIGEFAYRIRKVRRALTVAAAAFCLTLVIGILAVVFMNELARVVTLVSVFAAAVIVFVVTIPIGNANYICPACGERPTFRGEDELAIDLSIAVCERCGAALK